MANPLHRLALTLAAIAVCAVPHAAHAHSIDLFAHIVGEEIHGIVSYSDGSPAVSHAVEVSWNPTDSAHEGDENSAMIQTDDAGKFVFRPKINAEHLFICRTVDGHRAAYSVQFGIDADDAVAERSHPAFDEQTGTSIERQIGALQEQLHEHEQRTRLHDVLGGIGYIVGIAGVIALIKTRRRET